MSNKIKIAITDNHQGIVKALRNIMEDNGFETIIESSNGEDLISRIAQSSIIPDICILDGNMPVMDGSQTVVELINRWPTIKIIAFTMDTMYGNDMVEKGASVFLLKSNTPEMLIDTINKLMNAV